MMCWGDSQPMIHFNGIMISVLLFSWLLQPCGALSSDICRVLLCRGLTSDPREKVCCSTLKTDSGIDH